jgi:hypothetical protein
LHAEKDAEERYYRDTAPWYPTSPDFSFLVVDILRARERVLQYLRLFAEEVIEAHLREYLEVNPSDLLTNPALFESVARTVAISADQLWTGYGAVLFLEPGSRQARHERAMTERTLDQHSEPEPWRYPNPEQWANTWRRLTEPDSEMERLDEQQKTTVETAVADLTRQYREKAASRLGVTLVDRPDMNREKQPPADPASEDITTSQVEACSEQAGTRFSTPAPASQELSGRAEEGQVREPSPIVLSELSSQQEGKNHPGPYVNNIGDERGNSAPVVGSPDDGEMAALRDLNVAPAARNRYEQAQPAALSYATDTSPHSDGPAAKVEESQALFEHFEYAFRNRGETWSLAFKGKFVTVRHQVGLTYIVELLRSPRRNVEALALASQRVSGQVISGGIEVADSKAIRTVREALDERRTEWASLAEETNESKKKQLKVEIQKLEEYLDQARKTAGTVGRARSAVTNAINRTIEKICKVHPEMAAHLDHSIRRGVVLAYLPEEVPDWEF